MSRKLFCTLVFILALTVSASACNLKKTVSTPTPFSYPTPDLTMTALFAPAEEIAATSAAATSAVATSAPAEPLSSPLSITPVGVTSTPTATTTPTDIPPSATPYPTWTPVPTAIDYSGPGVRSGAGVIAARLSTSPTIDGDLSEWSETVYPVENVAYGAGNHSSAADLSGTMMVGWDDAYLYFGAEVVDDVYVQEATGENLFKGDSIEIVIDFNVSGDFYWAQLSGDDYQLGVSPGKTTVGNSPEAYLWFPWNVAGARSQVQIGTSTTATGYVVEFAVPWSMFGISPAVGNHFGFGFSISDNDNAGTTIQQSMVSNLAARVLANPMTWGDLLLGE